MLLWRREPEKVERDAEDVRKDLERLEMIRKKRCAGEDFVLAKLKDDSWEISWQDQALTMWASNPQKAGQHARQV